MTSTETPGTAEVLPRISGTFHRADGEKVEFQITETVAMQWGQPVSELGQTVDLLLALETAAHEAEFFDPAETCSQCGDPLDDGEGWNGLCGNCADKADPADQDEEPTPAPVPAHLVIKPGTVRIGGMEWPL